MMAKSNNSSFNIKDGDDSFVLKIDDSELYVQKNDDEFLPIDSFKESFDRIIDFDSREWKDECDEGWDEYDYESCFLWNNGIIWKGAFIYSISNSFDNFTRNMEIIEVNNMGNIGSPAFVYVLKIRKDKYIFPYKLSDNYEGWLAPDDNAHSPMTSKEIYDNFSKIKVGDYYPYGKLVIELNEKDGLTFHKIQKRKKTSLTKSEAMSYLRLLTTDLN